MSFKASRRIYRQSFVLCALLLPVLTLSRIYADGLPPDSSRSGYSILERGGIARYQEGTGTPVEMIVTSEADFWAAFVVAPVARHLSRGRLPAVLVSPRVPGADFARFAARLKPARALLLGSQPEPLAQGLGLQNTSNVTTDIDPCAAALLVARTFWGETEQIVMASTEDLQAATLAACLAAQRGVPFIPWTEALPRQLLIDSLSALKPQKILLVGESLTGPPAWTSGSNLTVESVSQMQCEKLLAEALGASQVKNLILARAESDSSRGGLSYAPYWSLARHSFVVVCEDGGADETEGRVASAIARHGFTPRSLTIFGGTGVIEDKTLANPDILGEYDVQIEPCSWPDISKAAPLGVGRIPFDDTSAISLVLSRGLLRERLLGQQTPQVLMIANPQAEVGVLPLAETVSRATAAEFNNAGAQVVEFYGADGNNPRIREVAPEAEWIIYEGHVTDQNLFPDVSDPDAETCPPFLRENEPRLGLISVLDLIPGARSDEKHRLLTYALTPEMRIFDGCETSSSADLTETSQVTEEPEETPPSDEVGADEPETATPAQASTDQPGTLTEQSEIHPEQTDSPAAQTENLFRRIVRIIVEDVPESAGDDDEQEVRRLSYLVTPVEDDQLALVVPPQSEDESDSETSPEDPSDESDYMDMQPQLPAPEVKAFPVVILQSCHSLEGGAYVSAFQAGASAVVGTVTNVHSASGSSFIKSYCDSVIYRGATLGEALREAKNYFLLLSSLKKGRGHTEQAKGVRVAMSFRLYGDPELDVALGRFDAYRHRPLAANWLDNTSFTIKTPKRRLEEVRTDKYTARLMASSQTAGLVRRLKDKPERKLMPLYYFRLDSPPLFNAAAFNTLTRPEDQSPRAVFLADPYKRYVWVLYLPEKDKTNDLLQLRFTP
jgi:hypothetical protein